VKDKLNHKLRVNLRRFRVKDRHKKKRKRGKKSYQLNIKLRQLLRYNFL